MGTTSGTTLLTLDEMITRALTQGITMVQEVGSPLHPFLLDEGGNLYLLFDESGTVDPMELALQAIRDKVPGIQRAVLVIDTRLTRSDGRKVDAITAMSCDRARETSPVWAQCYVPKGLFRKFRTEGTPEQVGEAKNFITVALAE